MKVNLTKKKEKKNHVNPLLLPRVRPFNWESQPSTDHTYVQDSSYSFPAHPSLSSFLSSLLPYAHKVHGCKWSQTPPDINLIKVQSIFSSFCLQRFIKGLLHQTFLSPLFSPAFTSSSSSSSSSSCSSWWWDRRDWGTAIVGWQLYVYRSELGGGGWHVGELGGGGRGHQYGSTHAIFKGVGAVQCSLGKTRSLTLTRQGERGRGRKRGGGGGGASQQCRRSRLSRSWPPAGMTPPSPSGGPWPPPLWETAVKRSRSGAATRPTRRWRPEFISPSAWWMTTVIRLPRPLRCTPEKTADGVSGFLHQLIVLLESQQRLGIFPSFPFIPMSSGTIRLERVREALLLPVWKKIYIYSLDFNTFPFTVASFHFVWKFVFVIMLLFCLLFVCHTVQHFNLWPLVDLKKKCAI